MNRCGPRCAPLAGLALLLCAGGAGAAQSGILRTNAELRAAPYSDAHLLTTLVKDTAVRINERRGGWIKVAAETYGEGWVRLHQVRIGDTAARERASVSGLSALWQSFTGRGSSRGLVATTGIRGMDADDLKNARPDPQAVGALERYQADEAQARAFAQDSGLQAQQVSYDADKQKKKKRRKKARE